MELKGKLLDAVVLVSFFIISTGILLIFKLNSLVATILYLVIPAIYLLARYEKYRKRILIFSVPAGIAGYFFIQYVAEYNNAWIWNSPTVRLLTYLPLEGLVWAIAANAVVIGVWKVFFDSRHNPTDGGGYNLFLIFLFACFIAFGIWVFYSPTKIEYSYARLFSLPPVLILALALKRNPSLLPKLFKLSFVFLIFTLVFEIVALKLRFWTFPGEYSGFLNIFDVVIPLEEFVLFITLGAAGITALYEDFDEI